MFDIFKESQEHRELAYLPSSPDMRVKPMGVVEFTGATTSEQRQQRSSGKNV